jgi:hypothetical protein
MKQFAYRQNQHIKVAGLKRGPKVKLSMEDKLLMLLIYYREYRTFLHISSDYGISEAQCWLIVTDLERVLIKSELFHLPRKKVFQRANSFEIVLVDLSESSIERTKKNSENTIQVKEKNTLKTQIVVDKTSQKIIFVANSEGRKHDYRLFEESKTYIYETIKGRVGTGYQGLQKKHINTEIPKKRSKKNPLTKSDKKENQRISSSRVTIENVIRSKKIFRIINEKIRNRRKRFTLRLNLITGIYNYQL